MGRIRVSWVGQPARVIRMTHAASSFIAADIGENGGNQPEHHGNGCSRAPEVGGRQSEVSRDSRVCEAAAIIRTNSWQILTWT